MAWRGKVSTLTLLVAASFYKCCSALTKYAISNVSGNAPQLSFTYRYENSFDEDFDSYFEAYPYMIGDVIEIDLGSSRSVNSIYLSPASPSSDVTV